jgi:hypothetical protein
MPKEWGDHDVVDREGKNHYRLTEYALPDKQSFLPPVVDRK